MHDVEKKLRYQQQAHLGKLERDGAKKAVVARLRKSIAGERKREQKGKVFGPRNKGF